MKIKYLICNIINNVYVVRIKFNKNIIERIYRKCKLMKRYIMFMYWKFYKILFFLYSICRLDKFNKIR